LQFVEGFSKTAGFADLAKSFARGAKASGGASVKNALTLQEFKHLRDATRVHGGVAKSFQSNAGRHALAEAAGRSLPSAIPAGAALYTAKKLNDRQKRNRETDMYQQYQSQGN
jgi:hypothetical protein